MMGKKKVAQVMQPTESGSFLAGQQPTAEVGEVSGIQKNQKTEQIETKDIVEQLKKIFMNRVLEKINKHLDEKIKFLDEEEKIMALYKLNKLARYDADMVKALDILVSTIPDFSKKIKEV
jgi:excinuclease UvrABC helicase subunit UvrB